jgi:hypothetical protein
VVAWPASLKHVFGALWQRDSAKKKVVEWIDAQVQKTWAAIFFSGFEPVSGHLRFHAGSTAMDWVRVNAPSVASECCAAPGDAPKLAYGVYAKLEGIDNTERQLGTAASLEGGRIKVRRPKTASMGMGGAAASSGASVVGAAGSSVAGGAVAPPGTDGAATSGMDGAAASSAASAADGAHGDGNTGSTQQQQGPLVYARNGFLQTGQRAEGATSRSLSAPPACAVQL